MSFSGIRKFFDLVQSMEDVVSLGVGEPDFPTPERIKDAGIRAIENDYTSYTSNYGLAELRRKISGRLKLKNNFDADPGSEILVTTGTSEALDLAMRAIIEPGDQVIVPQPCYVAYNAVVYFAGGTPVGVDSKEENDFRIDPDDIKSKITGNTKKTKCIVVASPNNPTGAVLRKGDVEEIADIAVEYDLVVISDELYDELVYDGAKNYSFAALNGMHERVITINGFSKNYAMTGWRIGYCAANADFIEAMMKIHQYTMLCSPTIAQYAAVRAFEIQETVQEMVKEYDRRRRLLVSGLNSIEGVECVMPAGAFYAFPNIKSFGMTSEKFCEELLNKYRVAVVPGSTFGASGAGYVRCSYAASTRTIKEAVERIGKFCSEI